MSHTTPHIARWVVASAIALTLIGCASPATRESMMPRDIVVGKQFPFTLSVQTSGGSETGAMDSSNISDADFKAAIEQAVVQSKLFKGIVQGAGGDHELSVRVVTLSKPIFGLTFTVDLETTWSLVKVSDRSVAMRKAIKSAGTATTSDSLAGITRLRMAVEAAARDSISQGLKAMSELNL